MLLIKWDRESSDIRSGQRAPRALVAVCSKVQPLPSEPACPRATSEEQWPVGAASLAGAPGVSRAGHEKKVIVKKQDGTLTLSCTACSRFHHFSILYWLGNGSFIEHLPGRLREGSMSREHRGRSTQLRRALVLEELSPALRSTSFSCVFTDPEQTVQRHVVLAQLWAGLRTVMPPTQEAPPSSGSPLPHHPDR
ncbi:interleukin-18-binding protein isoform X3 [Equus quagga]|uniref:interleukin-18-binding protein isoform X3 n=1 Tax=Equus quagga TaxID=89248 RepID=UPI001EE22714|nr:interleukin-18-binding protein isoform X3 [Equus quagga]